MLVGNYLKSNMTGRKALGVNLRRIIVNSHHFDVFSIAAPTEKEEGKENKQILPQTRQSGKKGGRGVAQP